MHESYAVNWNIHNIWNARGQWVMTRDGKRLHVGLYAGGWDVGQWERLDIWTACRVLNDCEATLPATKHD